MIKLADTDLTVHELCLGTNVMGFSSTQDESFEVMDAYAAHGGNFLDTADVYSEWKPGNVGYESETIIGNWMKARGNRDKIIVATKVSKHSKRPGLGRANILAAVEDSLRALQSDYIDIYYAHADDETVPLLETLTAFDDLIKSGKVRYIAASNYTGARLQEALGISEANGLAKYMGIQNMYNLIKRDEYENDVVATAVKNDISGLPWYGLARGFLTGKYAPGVVVDSVRAGGVAEYQDDRGWKIVDTVKEIAAGKNSNPSAVALAWLRAQPGVASPIASARIASQLEEIVQVIDLTPDELTALTTVSA